MTRYNDFPSIDRKTWSAINKAGRPVRLHFRKMCSDLRDIMPEYLEIKDGLKARQVSPEHKFLSELNRIPDERMQAQLVYVAIGLDRVKKSDVHLRMDMQRLIDYFLPDEERNPILATGLDFLQPLVNGFWTGGRAPFQTRPPTARQIYLRQFRKIEPKHDFVVDLLQMPKDIQRIPLSEIDLLGYLASFDDEQESYFVHRVMKSPVNPKEFFGGLRTVVKDYESDPRRLFDGSMRQAYEAHMSLQGIGKGLFFLHALYADAIGYLPECIDGLYLLPKIDRNDIVMARGMGWIELVEDTRNERIIDVLDVAVLQASRRTGFSVHHIDSMLWQGSRLLINNPEAYARFPTAKIYHPADFGNNDMQDHSKKGKHYVHPRNGRATTIDFPLFNQIE